MLGITTTAFRETSFIRFVRAADIDKISRATFFIGSVPFFPIIGTSRAAPAPEPEKALTLEEVRAILAEKSRDGFTAQIRDLLLKYGAKKLSEVDPASYKALVADAECDVVVCVPFTDIPAVSKALEGSNIRLGAQNVHFAEKGAYTGEISADMLKEYGVEYVIIGHSERRQYFGETDETVNKRMHAALAAGLIPIVCIGESLEERETGKTEAVLDVQIREGLKGLDDVSKIVIAYEPVWAIGTGKTATAEQANETIGFIRKTLAEVFCPVCAEKVRIQYGGSMNAKNCKELMAMPEIDGGLIGGASLKAPDFSAIVHFEKEN